jgi:hypothetical protein
MGQFKLEVPVKCQIDPGKTRLERDEDFYKVICPKKKVTAVFLE